MKKSNPKAVTIGWRPPDDMWDFILRISNEENRPLANVVGSIVIQYLSSTNGRLFKKVKVIEVAENEAA